jgi:hypothetical protein
MAKASKQTWAVMPSASLRFERRPQGTVARNHDAEPRLPYKKGDSLQQVAMPLLPSKMSDRTNDTCPGRKEGRSGLDLGKPMQINAAVDRLHPLGWHATGDEDVLYSVRHRDILHTRVGIFAATQPVAGRRKIRASRHHQAHVGRQLTSEQPDRMGVWGVHMEDLDMLPS